MTTKTKHPIEELDINMLENVCGGSVQETADDCAFLYKHGLIPHNWNAWDLSWFHWTERSNEIDRGFSKVGITYVSKYIGINQFFYQGREITREEAYAIIEAYD